MPGTFQRIWLCSTGNAAMWQAYCPVLMLHSTQQPFMSIIFQFYTMSKKKYIVLKYDITLSAA